MDVSENQSRVSAIASPAQDFVRGDPPPTGKAPNNGTVRQSKNGLTVLTRDS